MPKILFYTANGVGLGHLRRTSLIAKAMLEHDPRTKIFFASMCSHAHFIEELEVPFKKLKHLNDEMLENYELLKEAKEGNITTLKKIIENFQPDTIVVDVHLFGYSFPEIILEPAYAKIRKVLIWRKGDDKSFRDILKNKKDILDKFAQVIFPHLEREFKETLASDIYQEISTNKKYFVSGLIYKKVDKNIVEQQRKKYRIDKNDFLILVTLGGGGELVLGECQTPLDIMTDFIKIFKLIKIKHKKLKAIIVGGPLFKHQDKVKKILASANKSIRFVPYDDNFLELISLADLVISPVGYNTSNEIVSTKTPAIFVPLLRGSFEQQERAEYLAQKGICRVYNSRNKDDMIKNIKHMIKNIDSYKENFDNLQISEPGNKTAARIILKDYE